jgi:hypothetical protein
MTKKTDREINTELYQLLSFWTTKQDLERSTDFEKLKPVLYDQLPWILDTWNEYKQAKRKLDIFCDSALTELEEELNNNGN